MWHDVGHTSNLNINWVKEELGQKRAQFPSLIERERGQERNRRVKASSQDLRSFVGRFSLG